MANTLDIIRRLIRQQTERLSSVANIHGAAEAPLPQLQQPVEASWLKLAVPGSALMSPEEFYSIWTTMESRAGTQLQVIDGITVSQEPLYGVQLLRCTLNTPDRISVELTAKTGTGDFSVWLDSVLQRRASGKASVPLTLDPGSHTIEVVVASKNVIVTMPATLAFTGREETLEQPHWNLVRPGWLDAVVAIPTTELQWGINPRVGGWRVLRRQLTLLAEITDMSAVDANGIFGVLLDGEYSLGIGEEIHALHDLMGVIVGCQVTDDETSISVRLNPNLRDVNAAWIGQTAATGHYSEIKRIRRLATSGSITHYDTEIVTGGIYEYALQAFGLFDESKVSPLSEPAYVRGGDIDPPGPIEFETDYPKAVDYRAIVRYVTPDDDDYAGVRVYYRQQAEAIVDSVAGSTITFTTSPFGTDDPTGWTALTKTAVASAARYLSATVASYTATSVTLAAALSTMPAAGDTMVVFEDTPVMTDYGKPASNDELSFDLSVWGEGDYLFKTFDKGNNEQTDITCVPWTFTADMNTTNTGLAGLLNFRIKSETATSRTYAFERGPEVGLVLWAYKTFARPIEATSVEAWAQVAAAVIPLDASVNEVTVPFPAPGYILLGQVEPHWNDDNFTVGPIQQFSIDSNADGQPVILGVVVTGTILTVVGDDDVRSIRITRRNTVGDQWEYFVNGNTVTVDVADTGTGAHLPGISGDARWILDIYAYAEAIGAIGASTKIASSSAVVETSTASAPAAKWVGVFANAPATNGDSNMQLTLNSSTASGVSAQIWLQTNAGSGWTAYEDITAALSPTLDFTPDTTYLYDTVTYQLGPEAEGNPFVQTKVKAELIVGGDVVDTKTVMAGWYYLENLI